MNAIVEQVVNQFLSNNVLIFDIKETFLIQNVLCLKCPRLFRVILYVERSSCDTICYNKSVYLKRIYLNKIEAN